MATAARTLLNPEKTRIGLFSLIQFTGVTNTPGGELIADTTRAFCNAAAP